MRFHKDKKLLFVMPPRTGSTMFNTLLMEWGLLPALLNKHGKPSDAPVEIFVGYTVYGFFRNPVDRFLSLVRFLQKRADNYSGFSEKLNMTQDEFKSLTYDQLVDKFSVYENVLPFYFHGQVDWLANGELLDFNNYVPEVLRVARMLDITQVHVGVMNETDDPGVSPSQRVIDFVQSKYADDYRLGRERGLLV